MESSVVTFWYCRTAGSQLTVPASALTACPLLCTTTVARMVCPTTYVPLAGVINNDAASTLCAAPRVSVQATAMNEHLMIPGPFISGVAEAGLNICKEMAIVQSVG